MTAILLADHHTKRMKPVMKRLVEAGHEVRWVTDGQLALEAFTFHKPDLFVVAAMLPYRDGFQLMQDLRRLYPDETTHILLLTVMGADGHPLIDGSLPVEDHVFSSDPGQVFLAIQQSLKRFIYKY